MIALGSPIDADELRLRDRFLEIDDLSLTAPQAAQLLNVRRAHAEDLLESLEAADFLKRMPDGVYRRRSRFAS